jgi:hypothetical protein
MGARECREPHATKHRAHQIIVGLRRCCAELEKAEESTKQSRSSQSGASSGTADAAIPQHRDDPTYHFWLNRPLVEISDEAQQGRPQVSTLQDQLSRRACLAGSSKEAQLIPKLRCSACGSELCNARSTKHCFCICPMFDVQGLISHPGERSDLVGQWQPLSQEAAENMLAVLAMHQHRAYARRGGKRYVYAHRKERRGLSDDPLNLCLLNFHQRINSSLGAR